MDVNVQAAVEAQILGANMRGMISKTTDEKDEQHQTTVEFLVMPSALYKNEPITVAKVVKEINKLIYEIEHNAKADEKTEIPEKVNETQIQGALDIVGLKDVSLTFVQTFIHYKSVKVDDPASQSTTKAQKEISKLMEYAIGIHIQGGNPSTADFSFLEIRDVYINVWDTTNQKVLESMKIWTPEQLEQK